MPADTPMVLVPQTAEDVKARFGLDPNATGNRPRGWRIVDESESNDIRAFNGTDIPAGSLAVHTRDGASNPICAEACRLPNFIGTVEDDFDRTYRDYFYAPLPPAPSTTSTAEQVGTAKKPFDFECQHGWMACGMCDADPASPFQGRVKPWMLACFGAQIAADTLERNDRFIEEALELVQSLGYSGDRAHALVDYVFGRPVGEPRQEVGGVMVTLAALCLAAGLDMHEAGEAELARITRPEIIEKIRAKQAAKPTGSALPTAPSPGEGDAPVALLPCPFCGARARPTVNDNRHHNDGYHDVECAECDAAMRKEFSPERAAAAWNRRARPTPATPEGLREKVETGWLVESDENGPLYHPARTRNASEAMRFSRQQDAEAFIRAYGPKHHDSILTPAWRAVEHRWG